jgi:hypothetical protein
MSGKAVREVTDILFPGRRGYEHHFVEDFQDWCAHSSDRNGVNVKTSGW